MSATAYPALWLGAARMAAKRNIPLVVNASGVPATLLWPEPSAFRALSDRAAYFAVRDARSQAHLAGTSIRPIEIVPDTALLINQAIPVREGADTRASSIESKRGYFVVHVNDRYIGEGRSDVARAIDELARETGLRAVLVAIGLCHGDDITARAIGADMQTDPLIVDRPSSVTSIAHLIAGSAFYAGASLHGFITATSYCVPQFLVIPGSKQHKFDGFADHVGAGDHVFATWRDLLAHIRTRGPEGLVWGASSTRDGAIAQLEAHWDRVRKCLVGEGRQATTAGRLTRNWILPSLSQRNRVLVARGKIQSLLSNRTA